MTNKRTIAVLSLVCSVAMPLLAGPTAKPYPLLSAPPEEMTEAEGFHPLVSGGHAVLTFANYGGDTNTFQFTCSNGLSLVQHGYGVAAFTLFISNVCPAGDMFFPMWCAFPSYDPTVSFRAYDNYTNPPLVSPLRMWDNNGSGQYNWTGMHFYPAWQLHTPFNPAATLTTGAASTKIWGWCNTGSPIQGDEGEVDAESTEPQEVPAVPDDK